jgi:transposase
MHPRAPSTGAAGRRQAGAAEQRHSQAREFEPSAQTIRAWAGQDRVDAGERPGLTSDEKEELAQLRREVKQLREEKEILRKATVFFVRETGR